MKILHVDTNHPLLIQKLNELGCTNDEDYRSSKVEIEGKIGSYDGMVIRSRFSIDKTFLDSAKNLKFIARVGAGLENIDREYAKSKNIELIAAPEGNRNAVAEHALGMLLSIMNNFSKADKEVRNGHWLREGNQGTELDGKTLGIIGYGNMGKGFAKKLKGFDLEILCYDIKQNVADENAEQVELEILQKKSDVVSLHTPETPSTLGIINKSFIDGFAKPFWFLNTARGKSVVTEDLVDALKEGKILGAGLDVLEYEKSSFEDMFISGTENLPSAFQYLTEAENVILTPHVAGWTVESKIKLAQTVVDKIKDEFC